MPKRIWKRTTEQNMDMVSVGWWQKVQLGIETRFHSLMHDNWHPEYLLTLVITRLNLVWVQVQLMRVVKFSLRIFGRGDRYCSWLQFLFNYGYHNKAHCRVYRWKLVPVRFQTAVTRRDTFSSFHVQRCWRDVSLLGWRTLCVWYHLSQSTRW